MDGYDPIYCFWFGLVAGYVPLFAAAAPRAVVDTNMGKIILELNERQAPQTVANFVQYAKQGFYNNTLFHRVINGFMIQAGGLTTQMALKATNKAINNEANNGLSNQPTPSPWPAVATPTLLPANFSLILPTISI